MPYVIAIVGFLGAWLLVAGPLMQAWIELTEEELDHERFEQATSSVPTPDKISPWWWLLPPVAWFRIRRRGREHRAEVMKALDQDLVEATVTFLNKANAWLVVAGGAALLGVKETWELVETVEGPPWLFVVLVLLAPILCVVNLVVRSARSEKAMGHEKRPRRREPVRSETSR